MVCFKTGNDLNGEYISRASVLSLLSLSLFANIQDMMSEIQSSTELIVFCMFSGEAEIWSCVSSAYD